MKLVYFGSGAFGLPTLQALSSRHDVLCVVTQPDKPAGRGGRISPTPIGAWAAEHLPAVPLIKPPKVNDPAIIEQVRAFPADAWVVIAFGQKLSRALLQDRFAVNLHASLLPRWRGAAPINAAILGGDMVTGNTVITLADRMDAGLILGQNTRQIESLTTAGELHDLLANDGPALVEQVLVKHASGTLTPQTQDESLVTIATKLSKSDGQADFAQRADFVRRTVHALTPWPGVTCSLNTSPAQQLKVLRVQTAPGTHQEDPGTIIDPTNGLVACGQHTLLKLIEVQPPGKRPMPWADFARGRAIPPMTTLGPPGEGGA